MFELISDLINNLIGIWIPQGDLHADLSTSDFLTVYEFITEYTFILHTKMYPSCPHTLCIKCVLLLHITLITKKKLPWCFWTFCSCSQSNIKDTRKETSELICQGKILRLNLRKMIWYTSLNLVTLCQETLWWEKNISLFKSYFLSRNFKKL